MVSKPESAVKMFQQVLNGVTEEKWKTSQQVKPNILSTESISEAKKYHHNKFASYSFSHETWTSFRVSCLTIKRSMRNCWSHLGSFLHFVMDKLQQREDFLSTRKFLLQTLKK